MKGHVLLLILAAGQQLAARSVRDIKRRKSENEDSSEESSEEVDVSAPDVYSCCPEGSKLRLTELKNGGKTSECIKLTREEVDKMETWMPNLNIQGDNLPTCQRGLLDVVVEVKGQESLTSTTTTTTTTTPAPEESFDDVCERRDIFYKSQEHERESIIIRMNNRLFNIDPDEIDIAKKSILLKEIDNNMITIILGRGELRYRGNSFKKIIFSTEVPDKSYPKSCLYFVDKKSSDQGNNIVNVEYFNETTILATKITGSAHVPSGEPNFRLDMISHKLEMRYSWRGHRNPYWNKEDDVFESSTTNQIRLKRVSNGVVDTLVHISQFTMEHNYLDKNKEFKFVPHEKEIPFGWRLASLEEIRTGGTYTEAAIDAMINESIKRGFLCLENDAKIYFYDTQPVYEYQAECEDNNHKLIIKESQWGSNPVRGSGLEHRKEYTASLSSSGILETKYPNNGSFRNEDFCLATTWEDSTGIEYSKEEAITLRCDYCSENVWCENLRSFYKRTNPGVGWMEFLIGQSKDFEEFELSVYKLVEDLWMLIFEERQIDLARSMKSKSIRLIHRFLRKLSTYLFAKLDVDFDDEITATDYFEALKIMKHGSNLNHVDISSDIEKNKEELERKLLLLPWPLYQLFRIVDSDKNKGFTSEEVETFINRISGVFGKNEDCITDLEEIMRVLDEVKTSKEVQLAIRQLLQQELAVGEHLVKRFLQLADENHDNYTSIDEVINFTNFDFIESDGQAYLFVAEPNYRTVRFITSNNGNEDTWLEILGNFATKLAEEVNKQDIKCP